MKETKKDKKDIVQDFSLETLEVNADNIEDFEFMPNRRLISNEHVAKIHGALIRGENPISVITVNKKNGKLKLIDGNHRIEAIKRFYNYNDTNKKKKIMISMKAYENLTEDQEREVYSREANRRNETYEDRLQLHKDNLPFWKLVQDDFPCRVSIYPSKSSLRFRILIDAINTVKNCKPGSFSQSSIGKHDIVGVAMSIMYDDYLLSKEFMNFFIKVFGEVTNKNIYCRSSFLVGLMDIYVKNRKFNNNAQFVERFSRIINKPDIINYSTVHGREWRIKVRAMMLDYMNKGFRAKRFV